MSRRQNAIIGNSSRNLDGEYPETKVKPLKKITRSTSRPYQETDTGPGLMMATGSNTRRTKPRNNKKES
jgi:hypothetical protein